MKLNYKTKLFLNIAEIGIMSLPLVAGAQGSPTTLGGFIFLFIDLIVSIIPVISALVLLAFVWGLTKFIAKAGDSKAHEEGRNLMVWGSIALFVLITFWGILHFLANEFGFQYDSSKPIPFLPE